LNVHQSGDRVRIRATGVRGVILRTEDQVLFVDVDGEVSALEAREVTNFSLAARKAWRTRPKRAGRPRLEEPRKRLISIRLDIDLLNRLAVLSEQGAISSREAAVNDILRNALGLRLEVKDGATRRVG
jgi:uncharacterized protein (DUF4415 family)